jgi:predicted ester cyclase
MADDAKVAIRRMFEEAVNEGRPELVDELVTPGFVGHMPQGDLDPEGLKGYISMWRAGFSDLRCEVSDTIQEGDRVAWRVRASGTHDGDFMGMAASGKTIVFDSMNHARTEDGRLAEQWVLMDGAAIAAQLGAMPGG